MKKLFLIALAAAGMMTAQAQQALEATNFGSNWSIGIDGGAVTPMGNGHAFFGDMRGVFGMHIAKQISPIFGVGVEGLAYVNTLGTSTAIDQSYVGAYGTINLFNLFGGYKCEGRVFDMDLVAGAGWGHVYVGGFGDWNYFATKAGVNFNFNVSKHVTLSLQPSFMWDMSDANVSQTSAAYQKDLCGFNILAGVTYKFGDGFKCVDIRNQAEIDALNAQINSLRGELDASAATNSELAGQNAALESELNACKNRKPEVVKEVNNNLQSVRYIYYRIGSSVITADQQPNVEMIAIYLKNHPKAKVVIDGYASKDGNPEFNVKLAAARAESVKKALMKKYGIAESRITANGKGIGEMFTEESWNRVSICTLEE